MSGSKPKPITYVIDPITECYLVTSHVPNKDGYITVKREGVVKYLHKTALEDKLKRPIKEGMLCMHSCNNPSCINPLHLLEGTKLINNTYRKECNINGFISGKNGYALNSFIADKIVPSKVWDKPSDYLKIWLYILMKVNYADSKTLKRGEGFFIWTNDYKDFLGHIKLKTIYNCIRWLKSTSQISTHRSTLGMYIRVNNYDYYQDVKNY